MCVPCGVRLAHGTAGVTVQGGARTFELHCALEARRGILLFFCVLFGVDFVFRWPDQGPEP